MQASNLEEIKARPDWPSMFIADFHEHRGQYTGAKANSFYLFAIFKFK